MVLAVLDRRWREHLYETDHLLCHLPVAEDEAQEPAVVLAARQDDGHLRFSAPSTDPGDGVVTCGPDR